MSVWSRITGLFKKAEPSLTPSTIRGTAYDKPLAMWPWEFIGQLHDIRTKIQEIETLDEKDGQVKNLHTKLAGWANRGGIRFVMREGENKRMHQIARDFIRCVKLKDRKIREEHCVRLLKHGNLILQNVVSSKSQIESLVVMPTIIMRPLINDKGQFPDPNKAYAQLDALGVQEVTYFARWQIVWGALDKPAGRFYGRPLIDAERKRARQIRMTDDDMVIRRRTRAPQRLHHCFPGMSEEKLEEQQKKDEESLENPNAVNTDFYSNHEGTVTSIQGDAKLDQVKDVMLLNQKFYSGAGTHAHLFGLFANELNRDTYEDTLADLYELIEKIQETLCSIWEESLRLQFLLHGINADAYEWDLKLMGRKVETPNQKADRALKLRGLGYPLQWLVTEVMQDPWERIKELIDKEQEEMDAYSQIDDELEGKDSPISIVQGNARNKESETYVKNK